MKIKIYITIIIILLGTIANAQQRETVPESEINEIIELAIDLPELQEYFHMESDTNRLSLVIKEFGTVNSKNLEELEKFGKKIQVLDETTIQQKGINSYLNIGDWTYLGNNLRLQLDYSIEGITVNMRLNRINGRWKIVDSIIFEK